MAEYEACILGLKLALDMGVCELFKKVNFRHIPRIQNEFADALATISSMIQHPDQSYIDSLEINLKEQPAHCAYVEEEPDGKPWYYDIKRYVESEIYLEEASNNQKNTIQRLAKNYFPSGEILFRRTPDLGFLRCVDAAEDNN
ncbi:uncharacterized protein LOC124892737 [Capsicum annuum]|uniref:uncharacterized protein LOC124892737 n=1 Tax=Capsicum annuum TaxID=4072 RepID=UPI001FB18474|nr:uncharacterized protein LOC124892737 [Capsicum annuum]